MRTISARRKSRVNGIDLGRWGVTESLRGVSRRRLGAWRATDRGGGPGSQQQSAVFHGEPHRPDDVVEEVQPGRQPNERPVGWRGGRDYVPHVARPIAPALAHPEVKQVRRPSIERGRLGSAKARRYVVRERADRSVGSCQREKRFGYRSAEQVVREPQAEQ